MVNLLGRSGLKRAIGNYQDWYPANQVGQLGLGQGYDRLAGMGAVRNDDQIDF